jgi:AcrR family transcriptional regulator
MAGQEVETPPPPRDDDDPGELPGTDRLLALLSREMGPDMAAAYAETRRLQERWARIEHPEEGLRERKKRLTRQQISDVATTLFLVRGFEHVTVAEVADFAGVSEKTVYNYFPTKESLVFDEADDAQVRLARALREREQGESPTRAMLRALTEDAARLEELPEESHLLLPLFVDMIATTPALRAAWLELQDRLVEVARAELARHADLDPREPEPAIAARAIVGLTDIMMQSHVRHIEDGLRRRELSEAVKGDLERAARLLDTGLWSFSVMTAETRTRSQLHEAALATEEARKQVMDALKQARSAWRDIKGRTQVAAIREEAKRAAKAQTAALREEAKQAAKAQAAALREEAKRAAKAQIAAARGEAGTAGNRSNADAERSRRDYARFRQEMSDRHEAIRARGSERRRAPRA